MNKNAKKLLAVTGATIGSGILFKSACYIKERRKKSKDKNKASQLCSTAATEATIAKILNILSEATGEEYQVARRRDDIDDNYFEYELDTATTTLLQEKHLLADTFKVFYKNK